MPNLIRMTACVMGICLLPAISLAQTTAAPPQRPKVDFGKSEYEAKCASCHGVNGKGDGPTAPFLTRRAADLTALAKSNGGILPVNAMYDIISGEANVAAHGSRDMPSWGLAYRIQAGEFYVDVPYDPEAYVRARILSLIEYINRLQVK